MLRFGILATFSSAFSHPELKTVGTLFSNQNVNLLMFPIAVCVFAARIVGNEREGQTFRLQAANGQHFLTIFNHKLLFMMIFFSIMSVVEVTAIYFFGKQVGISIPFSIIGLQFVGPTTCNIFSDLYLFNPSNALGKARYIISVRSVRWFLGIV